MKRLRVLVLVHEDYVPPDDSAALGEAEEYELKTELDVVHAIRGLGHEARVLGVREELRPIRRLVDEWAPHVAFNLLEEFRGEAVYDQNVVSWLELIGLPYTGCSPRGLVIARDKAISKKLLAYHRIRCPRFMVVRRGRKVRRPASLGFPLIVKSLVEESSLGIAQASVVDEDEALGARVRFVHDRVGTDAIAEQFIEGRELSVTVLGNVRLTVLPPRELLVRDPRMRERLVATARLKHDIAYQEKLGVDIGPPDPLPDGVDRVLERLSRRIYRILGLEGYGRIDYRMDGQGRLYFLEANPNPDIADGEEAASAAAAAGIDYPALIQRLLNLGLRR